MFNIYTVSPNRVDIELDGVLDADTMRTALDQLIEATDGVSEGRMLYKISNFSMPTLGAIGVELSRLPKLFGLIGKLDRCAVVADAAWLRKAAEIEGAMFPSIDIKSFEFDQIDAAEAWLNAET